MIWIDFTEEEIQIVNKHMQRSSASLVIMRCHYTLIRLYNIKNTDHTKSWQGHTAARGLITTVGNIESYNNFPVY